MKSYRLIKEYPRSRKLGTIAQPNDLIQRDFFEKYSEFWEEVIEKDYEIISYVAKDDPTNITIKSSGAHLHEEYWTIHTVKRLSDGEVFTVGDIVRVYKHGYIKTIDEIVINDNKSILTEGIWLRYDSGSSHLMHAIKVKNPIFLTHDGKDIFVGDRIIWVNKDSLLHGTFTADYGSLFCSSQHAYFTSAVDADNYINKNKVLFTTADGVDIKKDEIVYVVDGRLNSIDMISNFEPKNYPTMKAFSNSKAAEEYVQKNKVCLSYNDVVKAICLNGCGKGDLLELINKKLGIK